MAYKEDLVNRIREMLINEDAVEEKKMFQGLCFLVNDKLCICTGRNELLCRIGEAKVTEELEKGTCRHMMMNKRASRDFVFVEDSEVSTPAQLKHWVQMCLDFNPQAKASKRKNKG